MELRERERERERTSYIMHSAYGVAKDGLEPLITTDWLTASGSSYTRQYGFVSEQCATADTQNVSLTRLRTKAAKGSFFIAWNMLVRILM